MEGDDWFFIAAAATTVLGIVILAFAGAYFKPPLTQLGDVTQDMLEQNVRVSGELCDLHRFSGGSMIITLCDGECELKIYLPYHISQDIGAGLKEKQQVEVIGTVEVYKGQLEVIPESKRDVLVK